MEPSSYMSINRYVREHEAFAKRLILMDKGITIGMAVFYPLFLLWLFFNRDIHMFAQCIFIPAGGFLAVTLARKLLKFKRPYEMYDMISISGKTTEGKSFPSRHVFSAFMIAETYLYVSDHISSAVFYIAGLMLMFARVTLGNHFLKDVFVGAFLALLCGVLFYI